MVNFFAKYIAICLGRARRGVRRGARPAAAPSGVHGRLREGHLQIIGERRRAGARDGQGPRVERPIWGGQGEKERCAELALFVVRSFSPQPIIWGLPGLGYHHDDPEASSPG